MARPAWALKNQAEAIAELLQNPEHIDTCRRDYLGFSDDACPHCKAQQKLLVAESHITTWPGMSRFAERRAAESESRSQRDFDTSGRYGSKY